MKQKRDKSILLFLVLALAMVLRLIGLDSRSLWLDEFTSLEISLKSVSDILNGVGFNRHTPPFYYLLLHFWLLLAPATEFGLRLLSALLDILNILLVWRIFSMQFSSKVGLWAAVFYSFSAYAVYYAQEGRMYTLCLFLVLVTYELALKFRRGSFGAGAMAALFVVGVVGFYTHYYYSLSLAAITFGLLLSGDREKGAFPRWLSVMLVVGLCALPWLSVLAELMGGEGQNFRKFVFLALPYTLFRFSAGYAVMPLNYGAKEDVFGTFAANVFLAGPYMIVLPLALLLGFYYLYRNHSKELPLFASALFLPPVLALLLSLLTPMLSERYLIVVFPFFTVLLALLPWGQWKGSVAKALQLCLVALWIFALYQHYCSKDFGNTEWREASNYISAESSGPSLLLVNPDYIQGLLGYYQKNENFIWTFSHEPEGYSSGNLINHLREKLRESGSSPYGGFWLVERGPTKSWKRVLTESGFVIEKEKIFRLENGIRVFYFEPARRKSLEQAEEQL